jgi:hypothetical protein
MEAGFLAVLVGNSIALSLGLAFGVLRMALRAMSAAAVPSTPRTGLSAAELAPRH